MRKISGFIISILLLSTFCCNGQDTVRYPINAMKGIRIGIDVSKPFYPLIYNSERIAFEATADMHVKDNFFAVVEAGWLRVNLDRDTAFRYKSNGVYLKAGFDYNLLKSRRPFSNDIVYAGFRYGYSVFNDEADNITIPGNYWPDITGQHIPRNTMNAHWLELLLGVRAEVLKNLYVGLTFRFKFKIVSPKNGYSTPYVIPGYGNANSGTSMGLNYYLSYNIQF